MKVYISHSGKFDFENELYKPLRESVLNESHTFFFPHEGQKDLNTKEILKDCDLVIAEVSFPSTGQGIELGWANTMNIPILCISKEEGGKVSNSLKYIASDFIIYFNQKDLISKLLDFFFKVVFTKVRPL